MGDVHQLVMAHGRQEARNLVDPKRASVVDVAAAVLEEESNALGITYSGFCLTSLPHRRLPADVEWRRDQGRVTLLIEPGRERKRDGSFAHVGVPYGAKARLILLYLQTRAIQDNSREIELGRSMNAWLDRMGVSAGGSTYKAVQEQATRINLCRLTFFWDKNGAEGFAKENIVSGGIRLRDDDGQGTLWQETVQLSETFFTALKRSPVPIWEPAIRHIGGCSMAIDVYVWLAYRLHVLREPTPVTWAALFNQFGGGYKAMKHFKPEFREALDLALAVYEAARVEVNEAGVMLRPSAPPIPERMIACR
ncbi:replication protein RepA [Azospirillum thermophilum]|uniref:Pirin n=1 Tax=Azospirillum thermophilum TaxID=2202148 RepID=A0A2S2CNF7_9PROT|nr:replication protein RepA [Azospirillum thermophilum]AWK85910.1 pirin [Azospirillum thermophilum]